MIPGEDEVGVGVVAHEMAERLADGIGRPLIPVGIIARLFGGENLDEPVAEEIHPVGLGGVAVERRRIELRQHEDPPVSACMQLLMGMSIRRYLPPIGTAGFERCWVSGKSRVPRPPPRISASTSLFTAIPVANGTPSSCNGSVMAV